MVAKGISYIIGGSRSARHNQIESLSRQVEQWMRFCDYLRRKFPSRAETCWLFHSFQSWQLWVCGFDPYDSSVSAWWQQWDHAAHATIMRLSRRSRGQDRDARRLTLRRLLGA